MSINQKMLKTRLLGVPEAENGISLQFIQGVNLVLTNAAENIFVCDPLKLVLNVSWGLVWIVGKQVGDYASNVWSGHRGTGVTFRCSR
jgi:hypothetical protein